MILVGINLSFEWNLLLNQRRRQMHGVLEVDVVVGGSVDQQIIDFAEVFDALGGHDTGPVVAGRVIGRSRHVAETERMMGD